MARFDVYATPIADERRHTPYWLDVQSDYLDIVSTRVVVPLRRTSTKSRIAARLNPEFSVDGTPVYADMANLAAFPLSLLRRPVASLRHERLAIDDALDFLFSGF